MQSRETIEHIERLLPCEKAPTVPVRMFQNRRFLRNDRYRPICASIPDARNETKQCDSMTAVDTSLIRPGIMCSLM
jgi:hypothetical protein